MYFKLGNTKIVTGKFYIQGLSKLEINFEYMFTTHQSYRRFAQVITDSENLNLTIKIKSEFHNCLDCAKLSQLLIGVSKMITQDNILLIDRILEGKSQTNLKEFLSSQSELVTYFL